MKNRILLSTSLCYLLAAVAMATETPGSPPGSSLQPPVEGRMSGTSSVPENSPGANATGPNTYTVEELYKNSSELHKKKVVVHGVVVKVTSGIMGKTWTHFQDGTGDKNKGTNDVICISANNGAQAGETVTITGTVIFKPESRYTVVIEDAIISK